MVDVARIVGFDWDDANRSKCVDQHGVTPAEAEQVFLNEPLILTADSPHRSQETRYHALGRTDAGRLIHVTFALRRENTLLRVIAARAMHRKEKVRYEQEA